MSYKIHYDLLIEGEMRMVAARAGGAGEQEGVSQTFAEVGFWFFEMKGSWGLTAQQCECS